MKRRTRSYLITHVAYDAKLRPHVKDKPATLKEWLTFLFFLFAIIYFTAGVFAAEVTWLPSRPQGDLSSFKRQVILHNVNRLVTTIKENNAEARQADQIVKSVQVIQRETKPKKGFKTKLEVQPLKGYALYQVDYLNYSLANRYDGQYEISLSHGRWRLRHTSNLILMLDLSYSLD